MGSTFAWLDYSEERRRKMLEVIRLFREEGTIDELGIGQIRDTFSDLLFPGTSTIQTRARYLLFVPWIYRDVERSRASGSVSDNVRRHEVRLIRSLIAGGERRGVVGFRAGANVTRLPSNIYWNGLATYGIRRFSGTQEQLHRVLESVRKSRDTLQPDDPEGDPVSVEIWHRDLPDPPDGYLSETTHDLTKEEAEYLKEQILTSVPDSFLAWLAAGAFRLDADDPWAFRDHPELPAEIAEQLTHARNFSQAIHSAHLVYNLLLAERCEEDELIDRYRGLLKEWGDAVHRLAPKLESWDRSRFWALVTTGGRRIHPSTQTFVKRWLEIGLSAPDRVADDEGARKLVADREVRLKGKRAKLENPRALELWQGASGTAPLDYRWRVARVILADIHRGLRRRGTRKEAADARA